MKPKFIADENIPFSLIKGLRELSYKVITIEEIAYFGIRNNKLAELAIQHGMNIITRDADFTRLERSLMKKIKVIYIKLRGSPDNITKHVLRNIDRCIIILQDHNVVMIDERRFAYTLIFVL
jgi:predicted nuclease of predicted toxin-antitoxin system